MDEKMERKMALGINRGGSEEDLVLIYVNK